MPSGFLHYIADRLNSKEVFMNKLITYHRWPYFIEGTASVILGLAAFALPDLFTLGVEIFVGWLFLFSAVIQVIRVSRTHPSSGFFSSLLIAAVHLIMGLFLLASPSAGIVSLTLAVAIFSLFDGLAKLFLALQIRPQQGWHWLLLSAFSSGMIALIIFANWPNTVTWTLGSLAGVNLLSYGLSQVALATSHYISTGQPKNRV